MTTIKFAAYLNEAGRAHVAKRLSELGLDWDVDATCSEIAEQPGFMDMAQGVSYGYEIRNIDAGKASYGALGFIEILPEHAVWQEVDDE